MKSVTTVTGDGSLLMLRRSADAFLSRSPPSPSSLKPVCCSSVLVAAPDDSAESVSPATRWLRAESSRGVE